MSSSTSKKVRLFFSAKGLKDLDTFSKSDPYLVLQSVAADGRVTEVGRTETIQNDLNPVWKAGMVLPYFFEVKQNYRLTIYDDDGHRKDAANDRAGGLDFLMSHVVCARGKTRTFDLDTKGTVTVSYEDLSPHTKDQVRISFKGLKMKKMDTFGSADPYYKLLRILPNGEKKLLYTSTTKKNTLEPVWEQSPVFRLSDLFTADHDQQCMEFQCYDHDMLMSDDSMGYFRFSLNELNAAKGSTTKPFILRKDKNKDVTFYGEIYVADMSLVQFPSFIDYLSSGWQINLAVSIDFTGSNGNPRQPTSLHYMDPQRPNQYVQAIMSVGDILMDYDTDKQAPVFGFGASINGKTEHFFHVNQQPNPYVHGVQGILDTYGGFLPTCILSGPTNFAPTIIAATKGARESERERVYTILLIITDGEITDMDATVDAIVDADDAPLSIVIVGVGNGCDFRNMDELDGDDVQLRSSRGKISRRDLVQFVPFRNFISEPRGKLAEEVLQEVPDQFELYARLKNIPDPRTQAPPS